MTRNLRIALLAMLAVSAVGLVWAVAGCSSEPAQPGKSREQVWIEAHPTYGDVFGRCVEFDDELCDDDPYDLEDLDEVPAVGSTKKPSAKPKASPAPRVTKRR